MEGWHVVAELADVPEGTLVEASVSHEPILLIRRGDEVYATAAVCPHKFGLMAEGHLDGMQLTCPVHTGTFHIATGMPKPGHEWAGRLPVYPVRVRDGRVEVHMP